MLWVWIAKRGMTLNRLGDKPNTKLGHSSPCLSVLMFSHGGLFCNKQIQKMLHIIDDKDCVIWFF